MLNETELKFKKGKKLITFNHGNKRFFFYKTLNLGIFDISDTKNAGVAEFRNMTRFEKFTTNINGSILQFDNYLEILELLTKEISAEYDIHEFVLAPTYYNNFYTGNISIMGLYEFFEEFAVEKSALKPIFKGMSYYCKEDISDFLKLKKKIEKRSNLSFETYLEGIVSNSGYWLYKNDYSNIKAMIGKSMDTLDHMRKSG